MKTQDYFQPGDIVRVDGFVTTVTDTYVHIKLNGHHQTVLFEPEHVTFIRPKVEVGMQVKCGTAIYEVRGVNGDTAWIYNTTFGDTFSALNHLERAPDPDFAEVDEAPEPELPMDKPVATFFLGEATETSFAGAPPTDDAPSQYEAGDRPDPFKVNF